MSGEWPEIAYLVRGSDPDAYPCVTHPATVPNYEAQGGYEVRPYIPAERLDEVLERLEERLKDERSQTGTMHTWRASAFGDAIAEVRAIQAAKGSEE